MDCVKVPEDLQNEQRRRYSQYRNYYKLDLWLELKKRWLILGVLTSILLAVVSPQFGAPGGPLRAEYFSYVPQTYIYYNAGRRARAPRSFPRAALTAALTAAHAHVVAPALCALAARMASDAGLHDSFVKGALLSSCGGPCVWLSLAVSRGAGGAALCLAAAHLAAAAAAPAALYLICGRAPIPALGPSISSALCTLPPFFGGVLYTHVLHKNSDTCECTETLCPCSNVDDCTETLCDCLEMQDCTKTRCVCAKPCMVMAKMCALVLVYFDCCERLREAEGSLHIVDVLGTMVFALVYISLSALSCVVYARGAIGPARELAVCAVPKDMHPGWEVSTSCVAGGAARLAAVLMAPAQALLLAAIADCGDAPHKTYHSLPR